MTKETLYFLLRSHVYPLESNPHGTVATLIQLTKGSITDATNRMRECQRLKSEDDSFYCAEYWIGNQLVIDLSEFNLDWIEDIIQQIEDTETPILLTEEHATFFTELDEHDIIRIECVRSVITHDDFYIACFIRHSSLNIETVHITKCFLTEQLNKLSKKK